LINLYGIESPGLTSSLAIADYVTRLAGSAAPSA
jgi:L-2-hydroxyglutarate oxidase LhgO